MDRVAKNREDFERMQREWTIEELMPRLKNIRDILEELKDMGAVPGEEFELHGGNRAYLTIGRMDEANHFKLIYTSGNRMNRKVIALNLLIMDTGNE